MKKWMSVLLCIMLLLGCFSIAFAEGQTEEQPTSSPENTTMGETFLSIDNENIYEGMDVSYRNGYMPSVASGAVTIILPLVTEANIKNNKVTVSPNLGDPGSSPFLFKNYQTTVSLGTHKINNAATTKEAYKIQLSFALSAERVNGAYPVSFEVAGIDEQGMAFAQVFTVYVTITDGKAPMEEPAEIKPSHQPIVIIASARMEEKKIVAGEAFSLFFTLKNTSKKALYNMTATLTSETQELSLQEESNVLYISKLGKNEEMELEVKYKTDISIPEGKYHVAVSLTYETAEVESFSAEGSVPVEITQPMRIEMTPPSVPDVVVAGETIPLSFQFMNLGRGAVYNVRCEVKGGGLEPSGQAFVGTMESGTEATADIRVFIGTRDMGEGLTKADDKYGETTGQMLLLYEDAAGNEYSETHDFYTTIQAPVIAGAEAEEEQEGFLLGQWWISLAVLGALIIGTLLFFIIKNKKGNEEISA
ncbi:MAG: hypothetical protein ACOX3W_10485 [Christensenellaceae bacterium]|jgi:hypothetical protein